MYLIIYSESVKPKYFHTYTISGKYHLTRHCLSNTLATLNIESIRTYSTSTTLTCSISTVTPLFLGDEFPTSPLPTSIPIPELVCSPAVEYSRLLFLSRDELPVGIHPDTRVDVDWARLGLICGLANIDGLAVPLRDPRAEQDA